jgi:uncharacterized protein
MAAPPNHPPAPDWCAQAGSDVLLRVKAVPGASRDAIGDVLALPDGARLKVRVAAPPEDGKANAAVCRLVAATLGIPASRVTLENGPTSPEKTLRCTGTMADAVRTLLTA